MFGARNAPTNAGRAGAWLGLLRVSAIASVSVCATLLAGSLATLTTLPGVAAWPLRLWMLVAGLPLLASTMAASALALRRLAAIDFERETRRLRERLYFVATVGVMVLLPAAVLALRWASGPRPGNEIAVRVVEALAMLIVALLLLRNASDAHAALAESGRPGPEEPGGQAATAPNTQADTAPNAQVSTQASTQVGDLPESSMSSIR